MANQSEKLWVVRHSGIHEYAIVMATDGKQARDMVRDRYEKRVIIYKAQEYDIDEAIKLLGFR